MILAIDPGTTESAFVLMDGDQVVLDKGKIGNEEMLITVQCFGVNYHHRCVIEMIASYGMPVGAEVFETCVWIGRFMEAFGPDRAERLTRNVVKNHLCHSSKANDGNIRQALIDRFGGKDTAIGCKKSPGPLYGVSGDVWAALAVAVTWSDQHALLERTA